MKKGTRTVKILWRWLVPFLFGEEVVPIGD
jgi:hypothetical protein